MENDPITLAIAEADDLPTFKRELQEAFAVAVVEEFGSLPDGPIPSDEDLDGSMAGPDVVVLRILHEGRTVGGMGNKKARPRGGRPDGQVVGG